MTRAPYPVTDGCAARSTAAAVGGGSDGNFTAAIGVPTLDGLGAVGGSRHAPGEWVDLRSIGTRAALVAGMAARIAAGAQLDG